MNEIATVRVVDDDLSFLVASSRMLRAAGFNVRCFASAAELLAEVCPKSRGCLLLDLVMPEMSGLELQETLVTAGVLMPVVILTGHANISSTVRAMRAGAVDFLEKCATTEEVIDAINRALETDAAECGARERLDDVRRRFARLTPREREVLQYVVSGTMNKQIAATLGINERTVKLHRTSITTKLRVHSAAQLATLAGEAHLFRSS